MSESKLWKSIGLVLAAVAFALFVPVGWRRFDHAVLEALHMLRDFARAHILLSLLPALVIAGAIATFINRQAIIRYLGPDSNKAAAYGIASVGGAVLAVCSCTVLPLFAGIMRMGAGVGPATALLYAGPAINVMAVFLTASALGFDVGAARAGLAVIFAVIVGLCMGTLFGREADEDSPAPARPQASEDERPAWKTAVLIGTMMAALVAGSWAVTGQLTVGIRCCPPGEVTQHYRGELLSETEQSMTIRLPNGDVRRFSKGVVATKDTLEHPVYVAIHRARWLITAALLAAVAVLMWRWCDGSELKEWATNSWDLCRRIVPLLLAGVLLAGFLLGRPNHEGLIPSRYVEMVVGGDPGPLLRELGLSGGAFAGLLRAAWLPITCLAAALVGTFTYFATLTEVPVVAGLLGAGMGKGPALALLLAGPAMSLPNMLVIYSVLGGKRTAVYCVLIVTTSTLAGVGFALV